VKNHYIIRGPLFSRLESNISVLSHAVPILKKYNTNVNYDAISQAERAIDAEITVASLDRERFYMLICVLLAFFSIHTTNMNVSTIIPTHVSHHHKSLSEIQVSYIIM
jgi:hypothetical protein